MGANAENAQDYDNIAQWLQNSFGYENYQIDGEYGQYRIALPDVPPPGSIPGMHTFLQDRLALPNTAQGVSDLLDTAMQLQRDARESTQEIQAGLGNYPNLKTGVDPVSGQLTVDLGDPVPGTPPGLHAFTQWQMNGPQSAEDIRRTVDTGLEIMGEMREVSTAIKSTLGNYPDLTVDIDPTTTQLKVNLGDPSPGTPPGVHANNQRLLEGLQSKDDLLNSLEIAQESQQAVGMATQRLQQELGYSDAKVDLDTRSPLQGQLAVSLGDTPPTHLSGAGNAVLEEATRHSMSAEALSQTIDSARSEPTVRSPGLSIDNTNGPTGTKLESFDLSALSEGNSPNASGMDAAMQQALQQAMGSVPDQLRQDTSGSYLSQEMAAASKSPGQAVGSSAAQELSMRS